MADKYRVLGNSDTRTAGTVAVDETSQTITFQYYVATGWGRGDRVTIAGDPNWIFHLLACADRATGKVWTVQEAINEDRAATTYTLEHPYKSWESFWNGITNLAGNVTLYVRKGTYSESVAPSPVTEALNDYTLLITADDREAASVGTVGGHDEFPVTTDITNASYATNSPKFVCNYTSSILDLQMAGGGTVTIQGLGFTKGEDNTPLRGLHVQTVSTGFTLNFRGNLFTEVGNGIVIADGDPTYYISNNVFNNLDNNGIYCNANLTGCIANNTIYGCATGIDMLVAYTGNIYNNLVWGNSSKDFNGVGAATGVKNYTSDASWDDFTGTPTGGQEVGDPFSDSTNNDLSLRISSVQELGDASDLCSYAYDFFRHVRPYDETDSWDVGAAESLFKDSSSSSSRSSKSSSSSSSSKSSSSSSSKSSSSSSSSKSSSSSSSRSSSSSSKSSSSSSAFTSSSSSQSVSSSSSSSYSWNGDWVARSTDWMMPTRIISGSYDNLLVDDDTFESEIFDPGVSGSLHFYIQMALGNPPGEEYTKGTTVLLPLRMTGVADWANTVDTEGYFWDPDTVWEDTTYWNTDTDTITTIGGSRDNWGLDLSVAQTAAPSFTVFIGDSTPNGAFCGFQFGLADDFENKTVEGIEVKCRGKQKWVVADEWYVYYLCWVKVKIHYSRMSSSSSSSSRSSSSSSNSSSSQSSSSSSSSFNSEVDVTWGNSAAAEMPLQWDTWYNASDYSVARYTSGDAWGDLRFLEGDIFVSNVVDLGNANTKHLAITKTFTGTAGNIYWRGHADSFLYNAAQPDWVLYSQGDNKDWRYIQLRITA